MTTSSSPAKVHKKNEIGGMKSWQKAAELDKLVKEYGAIEGAKSTLDRLEEQLAKI
ncbi:hypothetical protein [Metabacillus sediminilitoris]|uniref:hypothetical protein n=1 Tax=Metabacillus sediminilitoris TaxID=2567941 RepID=UPI0018B064BB|nr:hypothetical protein [Metabacillus sediminilitoris]